MVGAGEVVKEKGSETTIAAATQATVKMGHLLSFVGNVASTAATQVKKAYGHLKAYKKGDEVLYWSETNKQWIPATIDKVNWDDSGMLTGYDLDLGTDETGTIDIFQGRDPSKIIKRPKPYEVGEEVMYWSETNDRWMDATIDEVHREAGLVTSYDLNFGEGDTEGEIEILAHADPGKIARPQDIAQMQDRAAADILLSLSNQQEPYPVDPVNIHKFSDDEFSDDDEESRSESYA